MLDFVRVLIMLGALVTAGDSPDSLPYNDVSAEYSTVTVEYACFRANTAPLIFLEMSGRHASASDYDLDYRNDNRWVASSTSGRIFESPATPYDIGKVDTQAISDYLNGIECHYPEAVIVGLGERYDWISLNRFGRRFPVIVTTSSCEGNLMDLLRYAYYGFSNDHALDGVRFDKSVHLHSGGGVCHVNAGEKIYFDPAFGEPTNHRLNHTVSDITSWAPLVMQDSSGHVIIGMKIHDLRIFRGWYNGIKERFRWTKHELPAQYEQLGFSLDGDNNTCLVIDEPKWETRVYKFNEETNSWDYIETLAGISHADILDGQN